MSEGNKWPHSLKPPCECQQHSESSRFNSRPGLPYLLKNALVAKWRVLSSGNQCAFLIVDQSRRWCFTPDRPDKALALQFCAHFSTFQGSDHQWLRIWCFSHSCYSIDIEWWSLVLRDGMTKPSPTPSCSWLWCRSRPNIKARAQERWEAGFIYRE